MDLQKLAGTLLSSDSIEGLSGLTGVSGSDISNVLAQGLPTLLSGANAQAKDKDTSAGFAAALAQHAKDDTGNLSSFMGKVDMEDGSKIIAHLLGSDKDQTLSNISKKAGVSAKDTSSILSAVAPLLMSLLGQQADADDDKESGVDALLGTLLDNVDVGSLLTGLLTDNSASTTSGGKKKKKKKTAQSNGAGSLVSGLLKNLLK